MAIVEYSTKPLPAKRQIELHSLFDKVINYKPAPTIEMPEIKLLVPKAGMSLVYIYGIDLFFDGYSDENLDGSDYLEKVYPSTIAKDHDIVHIIKSINEEFYVWREFFDNEFENLAEDYHELPSLLFLDSGRDFESYRDQATELSWGILGSGIFFPEKKIVAGAYFDLQLCFFIGPNDFTSKIIELYPSTEAYLSELREHNQHGHFTPPSYEWAEKYIVQAAEMYAP